jgi:hypothetical protein
VTAPPACCSTRRAKPTLVNDGDPTGLPDGYDLALVHGGKAEGFKLSNVPLWQGFDDDFTAFANAMRRNYLTGLRASTSKQLGAFRPARRLTVARIATPPLG